MATTTDGQRDHGRGMSTTRLVVSGVIILLLIVFILQNLEKVQIDFLIFSIETSMLVAMLICAVLGAAAALLFTRRGSRT
jgi:uncharacterized integral membrane protein